MIAPSSAGHANRTIALFVGLAIVLAALVWLAPRHRDQCGQDIVDRMLAAWW